MSSSNMPFHSLNAADSSAPQYTLDRLLFILQGNTNQQSLNERLSSMQDILPVQQPQPSSYTWTPAVENNAFFPSVAPSLPVHQNNVSQAQTLNPILYLSTIPLNTDPNAILCGLLACFGGDKTKLVKFITDIAALVPHSSWLPQQHVQSFVPPLSAAPAPQRIIRPLPAREHPFSFCPGPNHPHQQAVPRAHAATLLPLTEHENLPKVLGSQFEYGLSSTYGAYQAATQPPIAQPAFHPPLPQLPSATLSPQTRFLTTSTHTSSASTSGAESLNLLTRNLPAKRPRGTTDKSSTGSANGRRVCPRTLVFEPSPVETEVPCQWLDTWVSGRCVVPVATTITAMSKHFCEHHNVGGGGRSDKSTGMVRCTWRECYGARPIQARSLARHIVTKHLKYRCPSGQLACTDIVGCRNTVVRHIRVYHRDEKGDDNSAAAGDVAAVPSADCNFDLVGGE